MKTDKELLKFFLEKLGLWEKFEQELESHQDLPSWDKVDDNLWGSQAFDCKDASSDESICIASHLSDELYLAKIMNCNEFVQYAYDEALADLLEYAGLDRNEPKVLENIPERASILKIVNIVNQWAWYNKVSATEKPKKKTV